MYSPSSSTTFLHLGTNVYDSGPSNISDTVLKICFLESLSLSLQTAFTSVGKGSKPSLENIVGAVERPTYALAKHFSLAL